MERDTRRPLETAGQGLEPPLPRKGDIVSFENNVRHSENLSRLHGMFYKGVYYHEGVAQTPKKKPHKNGRA